MELGHPGVPDEGGDKALSLGLLMEGEQFLLRVDVDADFGGPGRKPLGERGLRLIRRGEGNMAVFLPDVRKAAFPQEGSEHRVDAGVACLGGDFALAHLQIPADDNHLFGFIHGPPPSGGRPVPPDGAAAPAPGG